MKENRDRSGEELLVEMETKANAFNLKCLAVLCGISVLLPRHFVFISPEGIIWFTV